MRNTRTPHMHTLQTSVKTLTANNKAEPSMYINQKIFSASQRDLISPSNKLRWPCRQIYVYYPFRPKWTFRAALRFNPDEIAQITLLFRFISDIVVKYRWINWCEGFTKFNYTYAHETSYSEKILWTKCVRHYSC